MYTECLSFISLLYLLMQFTKTLCRRLQLASLLGGGRSFVSMNLCICYLCQGPHYVSPLPSTYLLFFYHSPLAPIWIGGGTVAARRMWGATLVWIRSWWRVWVRVRGKLGQMREHSEVKRKERVRE